ncbi:AAA family ATPase [Thalassoglobus polymorphus]|uniref:Regulatory protein RepA n=1 Tax=Thalassoglobus polymorphus TaxID=2527994 RepID=A0A517QMV3_9PLAN|nr:AAA family ATPase [Thalassoglobus polymorphus]QDT32968.1 hypothetical protein Mal48_22180 [Thalassoglobus polymorphus]
MVETDPVRSDLLKLANDLPYFARSSKPVGAILAEARTRLQQIEQSVERDEPFNRITAEELASGNFDLTYLIDGVLVKDQPAGLVAPKKSLKTNISIDLAISLATGGKFLGYFRVAEPKRMAIFSGESGMATIQETALRVSDAAGIALNETGIIFSDTVPSFGDSLNMEAFRRFLKADGIEVVIVDPVYLCLPCDVNPANLFDIGRMLRNVNDVCQDVGATPVLVHHLKKTVANPFVPGQLEDIGWAGFQEFFRQWMLINRREPYEPGTGQHRLWFSTGGSAGHSCLVDLDDVFEGEFNPHTGQPRVWEVNVVKPKEVISAEADRREEAKERKAEIRTTARIGRSRKKMLAAMKKHPSGESLTALADLSGLSRNRAKEAIEVLIESDEAETCKVIKGRNKREIDGYKLANFDGQSVDPDTRTK